MENERQRRTVFYGWRIVGATFAILVLTGGIGFYTFTIFVKPLTEEFGWSRTAISGAVSLWAVVLGLASQVVGLCMSKYGARRTMTIAAFLGGAGYLLLSRLNGIALLYGAMAVIGVGVAGTTLVPGQTLISHWFNRLRGRAMGLMMLGIGIGGLVMPPLTAFLIQRFGWRGALGFFSAAFWIVVIPVVLVFIRSKPSDLGLLSDGASAGPDPSNAGTAAITGLPVRRAVMSAAFVLVFATYVLQLYGQSGLNVHFAPLLDRHTGFSPQQAANFFGLTLGFSVFGRPLFGWLSDRWSPRGLMALGGFLFAAGTAVLEVCFIRLEMTSPIPIYVFGILYGCAVGGSATVLPILIGRCFGLLNFSTILGIVMRGFAIGVVLGPLLAGRVFDNTGSYEVALFTWLAAFILSAVLVLMVREEPLQREFEGAE